MRAVESFASYDYLMKQASQYCTIVPTPERKPRSREDKIETEAMY